jgi:cathepsin B
MTSFAVIILFSVVGLSLAQPSNLPQGSTKINDNNFIDWQNSQNDASWVAGENSFFQNMTFDEARVLLGTALTHISEHRDACLDDSVYAAMGNDSIPAEFDARTKWSGLIHPIRDQQRCGSCWAFSASEVLSDRVAIATNKASPVLSAEDMVSCDKSDMGCQGGMLPNAWKYLENTGLVTDTCFPYTAGSGQAPSCVSKCVDSESFTRTKAKSAYAINGAANMQKEIMTNGPIQVAFNVFKSFMTYKSGVYKKHFWEILPEGGHAVKIVGWGTENGEDYWLVANSWNTSWGLSGFFKIARGTDQCGIETRGPPYAGMPATNSASVMV